MPDSTPSPADAAASQDGAPSSGEQPQDGERTFTQSDVDRIIAGRLSKFSDYDDLKAQVEEQQRNAQTETERAVSDARKQARAEALAEANARLIRSEARGIAADLGWLYPADAHLFITGREDLTDDNGEPDAEAIEKALREEAEKRPALVRKVEEDTPPAASDAGIGVGTGQPSKHRGGEFFAGR